MPDRISDLALLRAILEADISEYEREAFQQMFDRLDEKREDRTLSIKQRQWAQDVHDRLGLETPCENLFSQGIGHPSRPLPKYPWEQNRPLRPPGR